MRHFRLNFFGCIAGSIVFAVLSALCFRAGSWAAGVLLLIPSGVAVAALWRLVRRLIFSMSEFVEALEMNDLTIRFPESGDPCISRMSQAMRRITGLYNSARLELETRKLYYDRILRIMTHEMRNAIAPVVSASGGHPFISIDDNGRGIPPEVMQNLFQPFFTTKPGGSGIGLCLSRQIARLHGGDFTLTSSARGTKALITLP